MILDCLSPMFPKPLRVVLLASGSILRSLCGVAAGSSKASLSAHFARWGNLGELNAVSVETCSIYQDTDNIQKDSSQETIISLMGMLVGCLVVKMTNSALATWSTLLLLLSLHILTNYKAVRGVIMATLSRQRANLVLSHLYRHDKVLTPEQISARERIFEYDGILRDVDDRCLGYCRIGTSMTEMLKAMGHTTTTSTGSTRVLQDQLRLYLDSFAAEAYILYLEYPSRTVYILLKRDSDAVVQLKAWYHAFLLLASCTNRQGVDFDGKDILSATQSALSIVNESWESAVLPRLKSAGWDLNTAALETSSGTRVHITI